jgi:hypothetical protein
MKHHLIPFPAFVIAHTGNFAVSNTTEISIEPSVELEGPGNYLVEHIGEATGIRNIINTATGEQKVEAYGSHCMASQLPRCVLDVWLCFIYLDK